MLRSPLRNVLLAIVAMASLLSTSPITVRESGRSPLTALAFTRFAFLDIVGVAANQTSRMVYLKIRNTGTLDAVLTEVSVNGNRVRTGDPLPVALPMGFSYTYGFRYDGPWEGSLDVVLHNEANVEYPRTINLELASRNPVEEVFRGSSPSHELARVYVDKVARSIASPWPMNLILEAGRKLAEAKAAYSRGDVAAAHELDASAVAVTVQAIVAQEIAETILQSAVVGGLVIGALALCLKLRVKIAGAYTEHPKRTLLLIVLAAVLLIFPLIYWHMASVIGD